MGYDAGFKNVEVLFSNSMYINIETMGKICLYYRTHSGFLLSESWKHVTKSRKHRKYRKTRQSCYVVKLHQFEGFILENGIRNAQKC